MADYKKMYLTMFHASEDALNLLVGCAGDRKGRPYETATDSPGVGRHPPFPALCSHALSRHFAASL